MPAPVRSQHPRVAPARRSARRSPRARGRRCRAARAAAAGRRRRAGATHGTQPATPTAAMAEASMPAAAQHVSGISASALSSQAPGVLLRPAGVGRGRRVRQRAAASSPRSGSRTTALTAVVPRSRPSSTDVAQALRAASRKRRTRSRSTGFQVPPSRLRSLPTMHAVDERREGGDRRRPRAGVEQRPARCRRRLRATSRTVVERGLGARHRPRDEDRVGQRGDDGRARAHAARTAAERRRRTRASRS